MSTKEKGRQILPQTVSEPRNPRAGLGSRIAARFADVGLTESLPELRGETICLVHSVGGAETRTSTPEVLARLGGTEAQLEPIHRRRDATE